MTHRVRLLILGAAMFGISSIGQATEYVKICSLYGADFYYLPGTDVCFNPTTGETRKATAGGVWYSVGASTPGNWVATPSAECAGGRFVKFAPLNASDFTQNISDVYETRPVPVTLKPGEFISKVVLTGGFDASDKSTFCLAYYDPSRFVPNQYSPASTLGCEDTSILMGQHSAYSFAPRRPSPPSYFSSANVFALIGNSGNDRWGLPPLSFNGTLSCWVCIQKGSQ